MENNSWKIMKKNIFSPRISIKKNKNKNLRNVFYSFIEDKDNNNNKKTINFPLNLTLFLRNQDKDINTKTTKTKNKLNINLSSFKPKNLNLKPFQLNNISKLNERNSKSRNLNFSNNSKNNILNIDSFNSNSLIQLNKIFDTIRTPRIKLKSINYTPLSINTKNSPIIINQIGLDNSSTTKLSSKLNNNLNNLLNGSIESDLSLIKNVKKSFYTNKSNINLISNERKMPSIFSTNINNKFNRKNSFKKTSIKKPLLHEIKKLFQKDIKNFDIDKKNDINIIHNKRDINNDKEKEKKEEKEKEKEKDNVEENNNNNKIIEIDNSNSNLEKNKFNSNFNLFKEISAKRHISLSISNFRNRLSTIKKDDEDKIKINNEQNKIESDIVQKIFKSSNKNKKHTTINLKNKNHFSFDITKKNENKNVTYINNRKSRHKSIKIENFLKNLSKRKTIVKQSTIIMNNRYSNLKIEKRKSNKFLEKYIINGNKNINEQIESKKSELLLNMQLKIQSSINKKKDMIEKKYHYSIKYELNSLKDKYVKDTKKFEQNNSNEFFENNFTKINNDCKINSLLSNYILSKHEFIGISSPLQLNFRRRKAIQINIEENELNSDFDLFFQQILKKEQETFKLTKSNTNEFNYPNQNWINSQKNIVSILDLTLKENKFNHEIKYINNEIKKTNKAKIRKSITFYNDRQKSKKRTKLNIFNHMTKKETLLYKKTLRQMKSFKIKNKVHSEKNYSILQMKKFFDRNKKKSQKNELKINSINSDTESSLSDSSSDKFSSKNINEFKLKDNYYLLFNCIMKSLNTNFINYFQRMEKNIDINQQFFDGNTLIILSTKEGNLDITKFLCQQGADLNIQNNLGNTALHYAIANQFFSIADVLKSNGAREDIPNNKGFCPWDCIEHGLE